MTLFGKQLAATDLALALAGVLGAVFFFLRLPAEHPYAAATYRPGPAEATAQARALLAEDGYAPDALRPRTRFTVNDELLLSMQKTLGRRAAIDTLEAAGAAARGGLPAYGWHVLWLGKNLVNDNGEMSDLLTVSLDEKGRFWKLSRQGGPGRHTPAPNRRALAALSRTDRAPGPPDSLRAARPDSAWAAALAFAPGQAGWGRPAPSWHAPADTADTAALGSRAFGAAQAVRLARYHLRRSALADLPMRADSAWADEAAPRRRAHVRFVSDAPRWGQSVRAEAEVTAAGALWSFDTHFEPARAPAAGASAQGSNGGDSGGEGVTLSDSADIVSAVTYGALFLLMAFLFVRRLSARAVDVSAALRDALWGGVFLASLVALLAAAQTMQSIDNFWLGLGIAALLVGGSAVAGAAVVFVLSSPADSLAREVWPQKLQSLSLVRRMGLHNEPVGAALLRGAALAGVLLGLATLVLVVFPGAAISFDGGTSTLVFSEALSLFGYLFARYAWTAFVLVLTVLLGLGTLLYRWKQHAALVLPVLVGAFVLLQVGPYQLAPPGYAAAAAGTLGTALAVAFWRYDALTCFAGYLLMGLLWNTAPIWLVAGATGQIDLVLVFLSLLLVLVVGAAGVFSRRTGEEAGAYVPTYLAELAEQQRLQRDIEIAQQVQRDFLPRRMPRVEGIDLAALCLPAREVGGDYYDFIELPGGRLGVVIGDVSGKGIEASFYMTLAKGFLQTLAEEDHAPAQVLRRLNALFCRNAPSGTFITMIYGVADPARGTFRFARAGHNPLLYRRAKDGRQQAPANGKPPESTQKGAPSTDLLRPRGLAIGLVEGPRFDDALDEVTLPLDAGDALVLFTDGFPEARSAGGQEFGEERMRERLHRRGHVPARQLLQTLADDVHAFVEAAGRHDDMTMVVVKRAAASVAERDPKHQPARQAPA